MLSDKVYQIMKENKYAFYQNYYQVRNSMT